MTLTFDDANHEYRLDGVVIPSVTQILEAVGIVDYSYIPRSVREMALERGSMVHKATEFDDAGDLNEDSLDPILVPYLGAHRRFRAETGFVPSLIEHRGFHPHFRFGGTLDRLGNAGGRKVLVDYKSNTAEEWVRLQLAAYGSFFNSPSSLTRWCVELHGDGTYRVLEYGGATWNKDFSDFLCALRVFQLQGAYRGQRAVTERGAAA